jgi:hypothetical protein
MRGDWPQLIEQNLAALRRGDLAAVSASLEPLLVGDCPPPAWLLLAEARRGRGDEAGEEQALDKALALDGRYLPALLAKGDLMLRRNDDRGAVSFLNLALSCAPPNPPPALSERLAQASAKVAAAQQRFADHLEQQLRFAGLGAKRPERFTEALGILTGARSIQIQQPTSFFYPGLPQTAFYDPADFPWSEAFVAEAPAIRAELLALLEEGSGFAPYVEGDSTRANRGHALLGDPRWSALYLWKNGAPVEEQAARCPAAMRALEQLPLPRIPGRAPNVLFSLLRPKTHIPPHWGMLNTRLICHLPLIVPDGCRLRVGNHERPCERDKLMIFDDSIEHEAWNDSDEVRVVLLLEIWNPALSAAEREALTAMFGCIGSYGEG